MPMDPSITEISDGDTTWRFDRSFLTSNWSCIWGRGRLGILPEPATELRQDCFSIGAELDGEDKAHLVSTLTATSEPSRFEHHAAASEGGAFTVASRSNTQVIATGSRMYRGSRSNAHPAPPSVKHEPGLYGQRLDRKLPADTDGGQRKAGAPAPARTFLVAGEGFEPSTFGL